MKIILIILIIALVLMTGINMYYIRERPQIAFVDLRKLQDSYKLKIELEQKVKGRILSIKNILDSLQLVKSLKQDNQPFTLLDTNIARLQYEMKRTYDQAGNDITVKVWDRLNPLIEKFGKSHHYAVVVGANGAGTVLYGDKKYDITNQLIKYVNSSAVSD